MVFLQRRRLLSKLGALGAAGTLSGCLDDSPIGGADADARLRDDAVVDYPGMVDGAASVSGDEQAIEYDEPQVAFELVAGYRGVEAAPSELRISRDLSGDTMAAFVAPVYVEADERFEYHVFANEPFVDFARWHVVGLADAGVEDLGGSSLERIRGTVHASVVEPEGFDGVAVIDHSADTLDSSGEVDPTGVAIQRTDARRVRSTAPSVNFAFQYDADAERLEITHEGGDGVPASELGFHSRADLTVEADFEGTVRAGDTAVVSVPSDASVRVVWESGDRSESATLAVWEGQDA